MSEKELLTVTGSRLHAGPIVGRIDPAPSGDWSEGDPERAAARWLADEYAALRSMPSTRIMDLIDRCWSRYPEGDRRQLGQALLGVLAPLDPPGGKATPEIRGLCERIVLQWRERILARAYAGS